MKDWRKTKVGVNSKPIFECSFNYLVNSIVFEHIQCNELGTKDIDTVSMIKRELKNRYSQL